MSMPRVSVIMAVYNAAPYLREADGTKELLLPVRGEMKLEYHLAPNP